MDFTCCRLISLKPMDCGGIKSRAMTACRRKSWHYPVCYHGEGQ